MDRDQMLIILHDLNLGAELIALQDVLFCTYVTSKGILSEELFGSVPFGVGRGVGTRPPGPQVKTRFVGNKAASASRSPAPRLGATDGPASKTGDRGAAVRRRFLFLLPIFVGRRAGGTP